MEKRKATTGSRTATTGDLQIKSGFSQPKPVTKPDEFERFEQLTGKLVNIPKSEIDEQRKNDS